LFIDDGKAILIEEFGKDYGIYFSILSAISQGRTTRQEIEDVIGKEIGGYLAKLENDYGIINKRAPIYEKSNKNIHYTMDDNFFIFWFRFIHKYNYMIEISAYDKLNAVINRDYNTFSGMALERYFRAALIESQKYTRIGNWWDRKGENEIDIIAEDELSYVLDIYEVKRNSNHIDMSILRSKAENFLNVVGTLKKYKISYHGLSMDDM
jgi:AAA+ ATPase superfamily predicted ATPase